MNSSRLAFPLIRARSAGKRNPRRAFLYANALYWMGLTSVLVCLNSVHSIDSDEGVLLEGAWSLLRGEALYTHSFQIVAPGSFYLIYWAWKLIGPSYWAAEYIGAAAVFLTCLAVFHTGLLLAPRNWGTYLAPVIYALASTGWPTLSHSTFNAMFAAWSIYFSARAVQDDSVAAAASGGLCVGAATLCSQHKGGPLLLVILGFLVFRQVRNSRLRRANLVLPFALAACTPLLALLAWPVETIVYQLITFPALHYAELNRVSYLPLLAGLGLLGLILRAARASTPATAVLWFAQLALVMTVFQRTDLSHILIVLFPACALLPVAVARLRQEEVPNLMRVVYLLGLGEAIALVLPLALGRATAAWPFFHDDTTNSPTLAFIRGNCRSIYVGPFAPGLYYEARLPKPTSYAVMVPGLNTVQQQTEVRRDLLASQPTCAVMNYPMMRSYRYSRDNLLDRFIISRYTLAYIDPNVEIYRLNLPMQQRLRPSMEESRRHLPPREGRAIPKQVVRHGG